ncbi:MAG TPA: hypothetical protein VFB08_05270 [Burkholderiales bacterium]|nr:hypothetical protein [Burkholderiales bacterium]
MTRILARPEARWALWAGLAGAAAASALAVKGIFSSSSSTAAIGFVFVPFVAIAAGAVAGVWGLALGHVVLAAAGRVPRVRPLLIVAVLAALSLPAILGREAWQGLALERAVHEALAMDAAQLEQAFDASPWRTNKYFLGAIAQNRAASPQLLSRMADLDTPQAYEPLGSLWDVKGENRKGIPVMRLVAHHPNTGGATLAKLDEGAHSKELAYEILSNPHTPAEVLARHAGDTYYLAEWGLALNPNTPRAVLERLSRSPNLYARMNLTYNAATPRDILERLAADPDPILSRNASQALQRRIR